MKDLKKRGENDTYVFLVSIEEEEKNEQKKKKQRPKNLHRGRARVPMLADSKTRRGRYLACVLFAFLLFRNEFIEMKFTHYKSRPI